VFDGEEKLGEICIFNARKFSELGDLNTAVKLEIRRDLRKGKLLLNIRKEEILLGIISERMSIFFQFEIGWKRGNEFGSSAVEEEFKAVDFSITDLFHHISIFGEDLGIEDVFDWLWAEGDCNGEDRIQLLCLLGKLLVLVGTGLNVLLSLLDVSEDVLKRANAVVISSHHEISERKIIICLDVADRGNFC